MVVKRRTLPKLIAGVAFLLISIFWLVSSVRGQGSPPMMRAGVAYFNDRPVEDGTLVEARMNGVVVDQDEAETVDGEKGTYGPLTIPDPGFSPPDVHFFVGGVEADESPEKWTSGSRVKDLHAPVASLETEMVAPDVVRAGVTYVVTATVDNVGRGDASNVEAVLSVTEGASLVAGDSPTRTIGTLDAFYSETVNWTLICTGSMPVTITVTPGGTDEHSGQAILAVNIASASAMVEQEAPTRLVAAIDEPAPGDWVTLGSEFDVTATISNTGAFDALNATAELTWTSGAELVSGSVPHNLGTLAAGSATTVTWTLRCTSTQDVTVTFTPAGTDEGTGLPAPVEDAEVVVHQGTAARLVAGIEHPAPGDWVTVGSEFQVTAAVSNTGQADAISVTAELAWTSGAELVSGPAQQDLDTVVGGSARVVTWTLRCTSAEGVTLTVVPAGIDGGSGESAPAEEAEAVVEQRTPAHLVARIDAPGPGDWATVGSAFDVIATISNTGQADAVSVTAALTWTSGAELVSGPAQQDLDTVVGGGARVVTWTLQCTSTEDVTLTVTPAGTDGGSGESVPTEEAEAVVEQKTPAHLVARIDTPAPGDWVRVGDEFVAAAVVSNTGETEALSVTAELTWTAGAALIAGPAVQKLDALAAGSTEVVTWTLQCTSAQAVTLVVTPAGTDAGTADDVPGEDAEVVVEQMAPASLVAVIDEPASGDWVTTGGEFAVTAAISNTGELDAISVTAQLTWTSGVELVSGPAVQDLDALSGQSARVVTWTLRCTGAQDVTLTVTPDGIDEESGQTASAQSAEVVIDQRSPAHLATAMLHPVPEAWVTVNSKFEVSAAILNTGETDALSVTAALTWTSGAELVSGHEMQSLGTLAGEGVRVVTWTLRCTSPDDVMVKVSPAGTDAGLGEPVPAGDAQALMVQKRLAHLVATIEHPAADEWVTEGSEFAVVATISNTGQVDALNATAALTWTSGAELVSGPALQELDTVPGESAAVVTWTLRCTSTQPVTLTVTPDGSDAGTGEPAPADKDVAVAEQRTPARLVAVVDTPTSGDWVPVGSEFAVVATISNTGQADAIGVSAALTWTSGAELVTGPALQDLHTVPGQGARVVTWTLRCTSGQDVSLTVTPSGIDGGSGEIVPSKDGQAGIEQRTLAHLTSTIQEPVPTQRVGVGGEFEVTAIISNTGETDAVSVTAALTWTSGAELVLGPALQDLEMLPGKGAEVVTWTLRCTSAQDVTLTVTPAGIAAESGEPAAAEDAHVVVEQIPSPYLETTIHSPQDGDGVPAKATFVVSATVQNTGEMTATSVAAVLEVMGAAELTAGEASTRTVGSLPIGASGQVSWTLTCTQAGSVTVTIEPAGLNPELGEPIPEARLAGDAVTLRQVPPVYIPLVVR